MSDRAPQIASSNVICSIVSLEEVTKSMPAIEGRIRLVPRSNKPLCARRISRNKDGYVLLPFPRLGLVEVPAYILTIPWTQKIDETNVVYSRKSSLKIFMAYQSHSKIWVVTRRPEAKDFVRTREIISGQ